MNQSGDVQSMYNAKGNQKDLGTNLLIRDFIY
jgi:hypothetical protein